MFAGPSPAFNPVPPAQAPKPTPSPTQTATNPTTPAQPTRPQASPATSTDPNKPKTTPKTSPQVGTPAPAKTTAPQPSQEVGGKLETKVNQNRRKNQAHSTIGNLMSRDGLVDEVDEKGITTMQKIVEESFLLKKTAYSQGDIDKVLKSLEGLTAGWAVTEKGLEELNKPENREKLDIEYLKTASSDVKEKGKWVFFKIMKDFIGIEKYLSIKGALRFVNLYLRLNERKYYVRGNFNIDYIENKLTAQSNYKDQTYFKEVLLELRQIKNTYFLQLSHLFDMMNPEDQLKSSKELIDALRKGDFNGKLTNFIWNTLTDIMNAQKGNHSKRIVNSMEINTMLKGLNRCWKLKPTWFESSKVLTTVCDSLRAWLPLFQNNPKIDMNLVDTLFLNLMLNYPFNDSEWKIKVPRVLGMIEDESFRRYRCLSLLVDQYYYSDLEMPQTNESTLIFLERLLSKHLKAKQELRPTEDDAVMKLIVGVYETKPHLFWKAGNESLALRDFIYEMQEQVEEEIYSVDEAEGCLRVCQLSKVLSIIGLPMQGGEVKAQRFDRILRNKYSLYLLFKQMMGVISMHTDTFFDIQNTLQSFSTTPEAVYELFFKFIIQDPEYFTAKEEIVQFYFDSTLKFLVKLFESYVIYYSERGQQNGLFIEALNSILSLPQTSHYAEEIIQAINSLQDSQISIQEDDGRVIHRTELQYAVECLLGRQSNFVPLSRHLLILMKADSALLQGHWVNRVISKFKQVSEQAHIEFLVEYTKGLISCLYFVKEHPQYLQQVRQLFSFNFIKKFLGYFLVPTFEQTTPFNRFMRNLKYDRIAVSVDLLHAMTALYLEERRGNDHELIPYEVRRILELQNRNGSFQINHQKQGCSFSYALSVILLSRQFSLDSYMLSEYPHLRNRIFTVLINLNHISTLLKTDCELVIESFYQTDNQVYTNSCRKLKKSIEEQIRRHPSYLGLEYLLTRGSLRANLKRELFKKIQMVSTDSSLETLRLKSHFLSIFWGQLGSRAEDYARGYDFIKHEMDLIVFELNKVMQDNLIAEKKQQVNSILDNISEFTLLLSQKQTEYYTEFVLKYHLLLLDPRLNTYTISKHLVQSNQPHSVYFQALIKLLNCDTFLTAKDHQRIIDEQNIALRLNTLVRHLIEEAYSAKNKSPFSKERILNVVQHGMAMIIALGQGSKQRQLVRWLERLLELIGDRISHSSELTTKQILILVLLHGRIGTQTNPEGIDFTNRYWVLLLNVIEQDSHFASMVLMELDKIYQQHPIFFMSACKYIKSVMSGPLIVELEEVSDLKQTKKTADILNRVLKKAISGLNGYHSIWITEILIQMLQNELVDQTASQNLFDSIRNHVYTNRVLHDRVETLLNSYAQSHGINISQVWKNGKGSPSNSLEVFSLASMLELLAYLRLFTFIAFSPKTSLPTTSSHSRSFSFTFSSNEGIDHQRIELAINQSLLNCLPAIQKALNSPKSLKTSSLVEQKLAKFELEALISRSIQESGLRQYKQENLHELDHLWKIKSGLDLISEVANIEMLSIVCMWVSQLVIDKSPHLTQLLSQAQSCDTKFKHILELLEQAAGRLELYSKREKDIRPTIKAFNERVYLSSCEIAQEVLFTNCPGMTSSLNIDLSEIADKLQEACIILKLTSDCLMDYYNRSSHKALQRFKKMIRPIDRNLARLNLTRPGYSGYEFEFSRDGTSMRTDRTAQRSRTIRTLV